MPTDWEPCPGKTTAKAIVMYAPLSPKPASEPARDYTGLGTTLTAETEPSPSGNARPVKSQQSDPVDTLREKALL